MNMYIPAELLLAVTVPIAAAALLTARRCLRLPAMSEDGIALQTVIVIVVMLAIAGGVAGVLLSRGNEVTADLEAASVGPDLSQYREATCKAAGHVWFNGTSTTAATLATGNAHIIVAAATTGYFSSSGAYVGNLVGSAVPSAAACFAKKS